MARANLHEGILQSEDGWTSTRVHNHIDSTIRLDNAKKTVEMRSPRRVDDPKL